MNKKRVHLVGANLNNQLGLEAFIKNAFVQLGWDVIGTSYRVLPKEEVSTRIRYVTDAEFILVIKGERICPEDIFACRIPTILYMQDSIQANQEANFVIQTKSSLFDVVFGFANNEMRFYRQFNKNSFWLPLAACPKVHEQTKNIRKSLDISFVGNLNTNRISMINYLLNLGVPINYFYTQDKYSEIISKTKININCGITNSGHQQRIFEILNMKGLLLTNVVVDENLFKDREHLVYYNDFNHLYELICYYIEKSEEREKISSAGQKEVLEKHLYIHRVKTIVDKINSL